VKDQIEHETETAANDEDRYSWAEKVLNSIHFTTLRPWNSVIQESPKKEQQNESEQPMIEQIQPPAVEISAAAPNVLTPLQQPANTNEDDIQMKEPNYVDIIPPQQTEPTPTKATVEEEQKEVESPDVRETNQEQNNESEAKTEKQTGRKRDASEISTNEGEEELPKIETESRISEDVEEPPNKKQKTDHESPKSKVSPTQGTKKPGSRNKKQEEHDALQFVPKRTTRSQSRGSHPSSPVHAEESSPPPARAVKRRSVKRSDTAQDETIMKEEETTEDVIDNVKEEASESEQSEQDTPKSRRQPAKKTSTKKQTTKRAPVKRGTNKAAKNAVASQTESEHEESADEAEQKPTEQRVLQGNDTVILENVLKKISEQEESHWFEKPVTEKDATGYKLIILNRTDLKHIKQMVNKHEIVNVKGLWRQLLLMFTNAQMFNLPDSEVHADATKLREKCRQWIKEAEQEEERVFAGSANPNASN
jgi:bromodomain-containing protein 8